jgi:hypothetical protein
MAELLSLSITGFDSGFLRRTQLRAVKAAERTGTKDRVTAQETELACRTRKSITIDWMIRIIELAVTRVTRAIANLRK